jgi:hypothetical protein
MRQDPFKWFKERYLELTTLGFGPRSLKKFVNPLFENWEKWLSPETFQNGIPIILDEPACFLAQSILKFLEKKLWIFQNIFYL